MMEEDELPEPEILQLAYKPSELPRYTSIKHFIPDEHTEHTAKCARQLYREVLDERTTNRVKNIFRYTSQSEHSILVT